MKIDKTSQQTIVDSLENITKTPGYKVAFQNSQKFWESKTIRPDIVVM